MTTVSEARGWLKDIAAWKDLLSDAADTILGVSSPRLTTDGRGTSDGMALPFHLDRAIDEPDKGGAGVKTEVGLLDLLGSWHRRIAGERGEPVHGSPIAYLQTVLPWAQEHTDWDALVGDIRDARDAMARITGHTDQVVGPCLVLRCEGTVRARMTSHGRDPYAWCDTCDAMYYSDPETYRAEAEHFIERNAEALSSVAVEDDRWVSTEVALRIWPALDRRTIWDWRDAGRLPVDRHGGLHLRTLNQLANVLTEKRSRDGWRDTQKGVARKTVA